MIRQIDRWATHTCSRDVVDSHRGLFSTLNWHLYELDIVCCVLRTVDPLWRGDGEGGSRKAQIQVGV